MASIENGDKLLATHPELPISAWILSDGTRFISDEGIGSYENEEGFDELWNEILANET